MALYDKEVEFWLTHHNPFFVLAWSFMVFWVALAMVFVDGYYWVKLKIGR